MLANKEWLVVGLFVILLISLLQKSKPNREAFLLDKKRKPKDKQQEQLDNFNEKLLKNIEHMKNNLKIKKNKQDYERMLIELYDNIGNESIRNLYDKKLEKSSKGYNLQQEGLNNIAKYLKNYKD